MSEYQSAVDSARSLRAAVAAKLIKKTDAAVSDRLVMLERIEQLERVLAQARAALEDMNNGWKYIRCSHGDLYGVGWDRAQDKADASIAAIDEALHSEVIEKR